MRGQTLELFVIGLWGTMSAFVGQNSPQAPSMPKPSIEGVVTSADDGRPLRKARVLLQRKDRTNLRTGWTNLPPAITDQSGHFSIDGLDEGQYRGSIERE